MAHALLTEAMDNVDRIRLKYGLLAPVMDERITRLWVAAEAIALGHGGVAAVTKATGILAKRIIAGKRDLESLEECPPTVPPRSQRIRQRGGGRKRLEDHEPELLEALEELIAPVRRGDPESPLRWTTKSTTNLADELRAHS